MSRFGGSSLYRFLVVATSLSCWLVLFVVGGNRPGAPILQQMEKAALTEFLLLLPMAIILWGWSNIAILAVLASLTGEVGRSPRPNLAGGAARGFFVFLMAIGGQLIYIWGHSAPAFHFPDQQTYFRLAGLTSFIAFLVGWRPETFSALATAMGRQLNRQASSATSTQPRSKSESVGDES